MGWPKGKLRGKKCPICKAWTCDHTEEAREDSRMASRNIKKLRTELLLPGSTPGGVQKKSRISKKLEVYHFHRLKKDMECDRCHCMVYKFDLLAKGYFYKKNLCRNCFSGKKHSA